MLLPCFGNQCISIHALVKRATNAPENCIVLIDISIHALVKRATNMIGSALIPKIISIHALVKRATYLYNITI